jgi:hypothetical protein
MIRGRVGILVAVLLAVAPCGAAGVSVLGEKLLVRDVVLGHGVGMEVVVAGREVRSPDVVSGTPPPPVPP